MKTTNIPIKKHTPKRRRPSRWILYEPWWGCPEPIGGVVQDIKRGLENPINVEAVAVDLMFKDYYNNVVLTEEFKPKSLLERITNKIRRK